MLGWRITSSTFLNRNLGKSNFFSRCSIAHMSSQEIRKLFVKYFEDYDHIHVPSSNVVPIDDPSLLFVNAGMNQFKSIFLGGTSGRWSNIPRIVNYQKCIRAGGKHNDLDDVGKDFHHQTFFEMLGNWSFNNSYGKEAACELAFNFLTYTMKINPSRLYVTYFSGNAEMPEDLECKNIWLKLGIPEDRILPFKEENFWEMGSMGPCGPCTEIHFDRIGNRNARDLVNKHDSVVEVWNVVFMQMNRGTDGRLTPLQHLHIDTGMGLERLVSIAQGSSSNFDTDLFQPLFKRILEISKTPYTGSLDKMSDRAYRIIADHLRAVTVSLADGASFGPDNRGFVMRKMLRRACWNAAKHLNIERGFPSILIPDIIDSLGGAYPELKREKDSIVNIIVKEEEHFWRTFDKAKNVFDDVLIKMLNKTTVFPGEDAWKLHDTYGLTVDVTEDILMGMGITLDKNKFEQYKKEAKILSKGASTLSTLPIFLKDFPGFTDNQKYNYHTNNKRYVFPTVKTTIEALFSGSHRVDSLSGEGSLVLKETQFYATEGGQKNDLGYICDENDKILFKVQNARKVNDVTVLDGATVESTILRSKMRVIQKIDEKRRIGLMRSHTGTHLLNWALQKLAIGAGQRGSSVDVDFLRFDYATTNMNRDKNTISNVEKLIQSVIENSEDIIIENITKEDIHRIANLQGELKEGKEYPDFVRVCGLGKKLDENAFAVELCSGTHLKNSSDLIDFVILSDKSAAKGVRRIHAVTGNRAKEYRAYGRNLIHKLTSYDKDKKKFNELTKDIKLDRLSLLDSIYIKDVIKKKRSELVEKK